MISIDDLIIARRNLNILDAQVNITNTSLMYAINFEPDLEKETRKARDHAIDNWAIGSSYYTRIEGEFMDYIKQKAQLGFNTGDSRVAEQAFKDLKTLEKGIKK